MHIDLDPQDVKTLLESLEYTLERVQNAADASYSDRQEKLTAIEVVQDKLRRAESASQPPQT